MASRPAHSEIMASTIGAIGRDAFGAHLDRLVDDICGIDFCACYRIDGNGVDVIALSDPNRFESAARISTYANDSLWATDPSLREARRQLVSTEFAHARLTRDDISDGRLRDVVYTDLVDRLLICRKADAGVFALSLLRWRGSPPFRFGDVDALMASSPVVMALVDRHFAASANGRRQSDAFASLADAQACFEARTGMPVRECEVCARIVFGLSVPEIAQQLGISADTVKSYVKRAYQRLGIASQRELVLAYLEHWAAWPAGRQRFRPPVRPTLSPRRVADGGANGT